MILAIRVLSRTPSAATTDRTKSPRRLGQPGPSERREHIDDSRLSRSREFIDKLDIDELGPGENWP
jgi:hypothetical protein